MAVVSVKTLHDGWSGSFPFDDAPTFSVVYLVEVDDPQDGNITVVSASGIPQLGSAYRVGEDFRADCLLKSLSTSPVAGTRNLWQVTASYGKKEKEDEDDDPTVGKTQEGNDTDDPLKFAVSMSLASTRVSRDATRGTYLGQVHDAEGDRNHFIQQGFNNRNFPPQFKLNVTGDLNGMILNGRAITNSVFRPFDPPPQIEYNRMNVKLKWNQLGSPKRILPYINTVNSKYLIINVNYHWDDAFGHDRAVNGRVHIPPFAGRIMGVTVSPAKTNGIPHHDCELEIEIDKLFTWRLDILDRGYATMDTAASFPTGPNATPGIVVTTSDVSEDGFANREPVLLDGIGQALNTVEKDAVYLKYGVYPEYDWHDIKLHTPVRLKDLDNAR